MPKNWQLIRQMQQRQIEREASASKRKAGIFYTTGRQADADWLRLREEIPDDRRDLTARTFGDPIFERSALYRKQEGMR